MLRTTLVSALRRLSTWLMMSLLCFGLVAWSPARAATPTLLATGFSNITAIASDGTNIYLGTISGQLYRMTKTGTDVRNIANVAGFIGQILFHNGNIWFYGNPTRFGGGSIYVMPQDLSAAPTVFLSGVVKSMGITGSTLYYWDGDGGVKSIPIGGGTPEPLLPPTSVFGFTVDGTSIFLQGDALPGVSRLDTVTKTISSSIPQATASTNVFVDANNVYAGGPIIYQAPKQGGTVVPLVDTALPPGQFRGGLLSDGNLVYYVEGAGGVVPTDTLKVVPVNGGAPAVLADGVSIRFMIKVDGVFYWCTTAESGAAIYRLDVSPERKVIGPAAEPSIAADPLNTLHAVVGFNDLRAKPAAIPCGWAESWDGGKSWTPGSIRLPAGFIPLGDPWVRYGPNGELYYACMGRTPFAAPGSPKNPFLNPFYRESTFGVFVAVAHPRTGSTSGAAAIDFGSATAVTTVKRYCTTTESAVKKLALSGQTHEKYVVKYRDDIMAHISRERQCKKTRTITFSIL